MYNLIRLSTFQLRHRLYSTICDSKWPSHKVRSHFLEYFCNQHNHKFIPSSSVLPSKHSGTYFTNSGMNQFKSIILGEVQASDIFDLSRYKGIANAQKCIRIGGKHSDIDNIGKDTYHHTFFEMLGNWSFGTYGKEIACRMAFDLLINVYKLDMKGLYFTYFGGDEALGLKADLETKKIWLELGVNESNLLPFGMGDNFWEMDTVGPCGPCTEIHYDRHVRSDYKSIEADKARSLVNAGTEQVIELWNLVFMEYNRLGKEKFSRLPNLVVDTGMGLERLTAVLNGLNSNYETDLFTPLFDHIYSFCQKRKLSNVHIFQENHESAYVYKVLADHTRSISFSLSDGLLPSRNGLGGFIKHLILKCLAICHYDLCLGNDASKLLCELVPVLANTFKDHYPELVVRIPHIQQVIRDTEKQQANKEKLWSQVSERFFAKLGSPTSLSGEEVWRLFKGDGCGEEISIKFIDDFCRKKMVTLDMAAYEKIYLAENEKAVSRLKSGRKDSSVFIDMAAQLKQKKVSVTDNSHKHLFTMNANNMKAEYIDGSLHARLLAIGVKESDKKLRLVESLSEEDMKSEIVVVMDRTCFYSESGGQAADQGRISFGDKKCEMLISDVQHVQSYTFHCGKFIESAIDGIRVGDLALPQVDATSRYSTAINHTGVHLLNHAIRKYYSSETCINQVSSSVRQSGFKFEFAFNELLEKPSVEDIAAIEAILKDLVRQDMPLRTEDEVQPDKANIRRLRDVLYPLKARVIKMDDTGEFCCGTHADSTGQLKEVVIRSFRPNGDSSFEVEACTGHLAMEALSNDKVVIQLLDEMNSLHNQLKSGDFDLAEQSHLLNSIADRSIQIEEIFKAKPVSYTQLQKVKAESAKFRPSKRQLQTALANYLAQELSVSGASSTNCLTITPMDKETPGYKFLAFDSVLAYDQVLKILNSLDKKNISPIVIVYNKYRSNYFMFASSGSDELVSRAGNCFDKVEAQIRNSNPQTFVVTSGKNFRILKCPEDVNNNKKIYFTF